MATVATRVPTLVAVTILCAAQVLSGCASDPAQSGSQTSQPGPSETQRVASLADSPTAAALGFDKRAKFMCPDVTAISTFREDPPVRTRAVASAVPSGRKWIVVVRYVAGTQIWGSTTYDVRHRLTGYCVADQLPDLPPSEGPSTPRASRSSPPSAPSR